LSYSSSNVHSPQRGVAEGGGGCGLYNQILVSASLDEQYMSGAEVCT